MKFLVDECLSPELVKLAHDRGHGESSHIVWRNLQGKKDWELKSFILDGDWTFVTRNSVDFRGPLSRPGSRGQYAGVVIHAGLVCLNGPDSCRPFRDVRLARVSAASTGDFRPVGNHFHRGNECF
jgi:hypothetical protein